MNRSANSYATWQTFLLREYAALKNSSRATIVPKYSKVRLVEQIRAVIYPYLVEDWTVEDVAVWAQQGR
jgi:hypothetical protein